VKFISYACGGSARRSSRRSRARDAGARAVETAPADLSRIVRTAEFPAADAAARADAGGNRRRHQAVARGGAVARRAQHGRRAGSTRRSIPTANRSLIERFIAEDLPDTEDQAMDRFLVDEIEQALNTLQRRDAKVLRSYFGLDGGREHTLEEIAGMLGVTPRAGAQLRTRTQAAAGWRRGEGAREFRR